MWQNKFCFSPQSAECLISVGGTRCGDNCHLLPPVFLLSQDKLFFWQELPFLVQRTKKRSLSRSGWVTALLHLSWCQAGSCCASRSGSRHNHHFVAPPAEIHFVPSSLERCDKLQAVEILLAEYFADDTRCVSAASLPLSIWDVEATCNTSGTEGRKNFSWLPGQQNRLHQEPRTLVLHTQPAVRSFLLTTATN